MCFVQKRRRSQNKNKQNLSLSQGTYPAEDHLGRSWTDLGDKKRAALAGHRIAGPYTAWPWESTGDWKYLAEAYQMPFKWNCTDICWMCRATTDGELDYKDVRVDAPHTRPEHQRSHAEFVARVGHPLPYLCTLFPPNEAIVVDWQHDACLGIVPRVCGSALVQLCSEGHFGHVQGKWKFRMNV